MFLGTCLPCEPLSGCQMRWDRAGWSQALGPWLLAAAGSTCTWVGTRQIKFPRDPKEQFTFSHTLLLQEVWNVPKLCLQIEGWEGAPLSGGKPVHWAPYFISALLFLFSESTVDCYHLPSLLPVITELPIPCEHFCMGDAGMLCPGPH